MTKGNICCYCNETSQYCSRVNGGKNYYCMKCIKKIDDSKMDYWKDCSFEEFLNTISTKTTKYSETPFSDHIQEELKKAGIDVPERKRRKSK